MITELAQTLLVVDDTVANIDILLETLGEDYIVRVATDGAAALVSVNKARPELILLDIMMPGMDGFEVCRRLKDDPATRSIPIIFITALNEDADEARGLALGAVDFITKPFNPAIVKARVRNHLELKRYRDHLASLVEERTRELASACDRLLELDRLKDDFLRMISHEIRTPANGVLGIGELIIDLCPDSEEATLYGDLFRKSSLRLRHLINDATMIGDIEKESLNRDAAISFSALFDDVRDSLQEWSVSVVLQGIEEPVSLQGEGPLLKNALETMILLATSFSRDKQTAHLEGDVESDRLRVRLPVDDLSLTGEQAAGFFEIGSSARYTSAAEMLGLRPVVAHRIVSAFGGGMKLVKGEGGKGYLEATFVRDLDYPKPR